MNSLKHCTCLRFRKTFTLHICQWPISWAKQKQYAGSVQMLNVLLTTTFVAYIYVPVSNAISNVWISSPIYLACMDSIFVLLSVHAV